MAKASTSPPDNLPASFEVALSELEDIVKGMEGGRQLALEDSLAAYQRGMYLLRYCQEAITAAEQKIRILENDGLRNFTPASEE